MLWTRCVGYKGNKKKKAGSLEEKENAELFSFYLTYNHPGTTSEYLTQIISI